jgi:excisionase family DNA binding protein
MHNKDYVVSDDIRVEKLKVKEFLKVKEVAALLDCSSRTVYNYIDQGVIEVMNIGQRMTRVKRDSLDKLIEKKSTSAQEIEMQKKDYSIDECISTFEIRKKFGISESGLRRIIIKNDIPKYRKGSLAYLPKVEIEHYLGYKFEN